MNVDISGGRLCRQTRNSNRPEQNLKSRTIYSSRRRARQHNSITEWQHGSMAAWQQGNKTTRRQDSKTAITITAAASAKGFMTMSMLFLTVCGVLLHVFKTNPK